VKGLVKIVRQVVRENFSEGAKVGERKDKCKVDDILFV